MLGIFTRAHIRMLAQATRFAILFTAFFVAFPVILDYTELTGEQTPAVQTGQIAIESVAQAAVAEVAATEIPTAQIIAEAAAEAPALAPFKTELAPPKQVEVVRETVRKGDTLAVLLNRAGVSKFDAVEAASVMTSLYDPKTLRIGQQVTVTLDKPPSGASGTTTAIGEPASLKGVVLHASIGRDIVVERPAAADGFHATLKQQTLSSALNWRGGAINNSLFVSGTESGIPAKIMLEMIQTFSYDVDFQRDIQPGDTFEIAYRQDSTPAGEVARTSPALAAALTLSGRRIEIFRFGDDADGAYYSRSGQSVRKALLKTPVDGARLTSGFGMRKHPILGYSILHRGVDFGVPYGTPVVAAGSGTVARASAYGGYGNYVRLHHTAEYDTGYAHLSRFAPDLRPGQKVKQGQIIGYVGATGYATGPHLHYEVLRRDVQINPVSMQLPAERKLEGAEMKRFLAAISGLEQQKKALPDPLTAQAIMPAPDSPETVPATVSPVAAPAPRPGR